MIVKTTKLTDGPKGIQPIGTEIMHKDAWRLVLMGVAEPVDQECIDTLKDYADRQAAGQDRRDFIAGHRAEIAAAQPVPPPEVRRGRVPMATGPAIATAGHPALADLGKSDDAEPDTETE